MGFGKKVYEKAVIELENRRTAAESAADLRLRQFYILCLRAEEISRQKASNAAKIVKVVLDGEDVRSALEDLKSNALHLQKEFEALLSKHNLKKQDVEPQYFCSDCADTGFIDGKMCHCLKKLQRDIAYEELSSGLPLSESTFEGFKLNYYKDTNLENMERILSYCKKYSYNLNTHSPGLLFKGATGLGKTHLSLAIANAAIDKGLGVIYGSVQSFAIAIERERFDREIAEYEETAKQLTNCDLLILDDLGTEFNSDYVNAVIYDIINTRMLAKKPTIISTNLSRKELEQRYGERFVSRITGNFAELDFFGDDVRFQKRRESM